MQYSEEMLAVIVIALVLDKSKDTISVSILPYTAVQCQQSNQGRNQLAGHLGAIAYHLSASTLSIYAQPHQSGYRLTCYCDD
jgi:hypothetical protein